MNAIVYIYICVFFGQVHANEMETKPPNEQARPRKKRKKSCVYVQHVYFCDAMQAKNKKYGVEIYEYHMCSLLHATIKIIINDSKVALLLRCTIEMERVR